MWWKMISSKSNAIVVVTLSHSGCGSKTTHSFLLFGLEDFLIGTLKIDFLSYQVILRIENYSFFCLLQGG